jgi:RNA polymerase sigma factor (sigma-70 family)
MDSKELIDLIRPCKLAPTAEKRRLLFEPVYRYAFRPVWTYLRCLNQSPDRCGDLCQEVMVRVYLFLDHINLDANLKGLFFTIARNLVVTSARNQARRGTGVAIEDVPETTMQAWLHAEKLANAGKAAADAIASLTEDQRTAFQVCSVDGLSVEAAAIALGWSHKKVKNALERGRKKLRKRLAAAPELAKALGLDLRKKAPRQTARMIS